MYASRPRSADPTNAGHEPRSRLNLDAITSEATRTLRAMRALNSAGDEEADAGAPSLILSELQFTDAALYRVLSTRLDALSDLASFEPAETPRQALFQLMLAVPCLETVRCGAFAREVSREDQYVLEKLADKATRLVYSAVAALFSDTDSDLGQLRQYFCDPADGPIAASEMVLSAV